MSRHRHNRRWLESDLHEPPPRIRPLFTIAPALITGLVLARRPRQPNGRAGQGPAAAPRPAAGLACAAAPAPQVGALALNANRHLPVYEGMGVPVWPDALPDYPGPLAGFPGGLGPLRHSYLVTVPCDTPRFPHRSGAASRPGADRRRCQLAMAASVEAGQRQPRPVFCLMHVSWRTAWPLHCRRAAQDRPLDGAAPLRPGARSTSLGPSSRQYAG